MTSRRGMTLAELIIALAITSVVGAGVVAMTDAVARVLDQGRSERERTIASAVASTRLSSIVAPCSCLLAIKGSTIVLWRGDSIRDNQVQATELGWVRFEPATGELRYEWVDFPDGWSAQDQAGANRTCTLDENWELVRIQYDQTGHLQHCVLLDGLRDVEPAIRQEELTDPLSARRMAWRLEWAGESTVDSTTVVAGAMHSHSTPEDYR
ncbi:MAG: prepilin-type N-terminal cleavage/methylation domain-containing protein [Phycisphaerales bacterium]|nr:prepilin-type N-terminal cleavage/methylation domain-containing protein [Phycisphaerales bacterium]